MLPLRSKSRFALVLGVLFAFAVAIGIYYSTSSRQQMEIANRANQHAQSNQSTAIGDASSNLSAQTASVHTLTPTLSPKPGLIAYNSSILPGLGFYIKQHQGSQQYGVKEQGNKILVYNTATQQTPVFIQVFKKNPSDTIQEAITKAVLVGYNQQDCPINVGNIPGTDFPSTFQTAQLTYSADNRNNDGPGIADISKCPHTYAIDDDASYFVTDTKHPADLLFIYDGQVAISAGQNASGQPISWDQTITFTF